MRQTPLLRVDLGQSFSCHTSTAGIATPRRIAQAPNKPRTMPNSLAPKEATSARICR